LDEPKLLYYKSAVKLKFLGDHYGDWM